MADDLDQRPRNVWVHTQSISTYYRAITQNFLALELVRK